MKSLTVGTLILTSLIIVHTNSEITLKFKKLTTSIGSSTISIKGKKDFFFLGQTGKKIIEYNIINFEKKSEYQISCTPLTLTETKEGLEYVIGCAESKVEIFSYSGNTLKLSIDSIGSGKVYSTASFKISNFLLIGSQDGHVYKRDSSNGDNLGVFPKPSDGSSAKIRTLEVIRDSSFFLGSFHSSAKCFGYYDSSNPTTTPVKANCGTTERVYAMKHASFSDNIYTASSVLGVFGKIYSYSKIDLQKQSGVSVSSVSTKIRSLVVVEKMKFVIMIDQEKIRIYDEGLKEISLYDVSSDVKNSDYFHLNLHEERNILALSATSDSSIEKGQWMYELTDLCSDSCELGTCQYNIVDPNLSCEKCQENFYVVNKECKSCPTCCEGGCLLDEGELSCVGVKNGFLFSSGSCEEIIKEEEPVKKEEPVTEKEEEPVKKEEIKETAEIDYSINKIGTSRIMIAFNSTVQFLRLGEELEVQIQGENPIKNFNIQFQKSQNKEEYLLDLTTNLTSYMKQVEIKISDVKNELNKTYPSKLLSFNLIKIPESTLGLSQKNQNTTKSVVENYSQYSSLLSTVAPALKFIALPTNLGLLIILLPFDLHPKFYFILRLFATYPEKDISKYIFERYYNKKELELRSYSIPKYPEKSFVSIYSRIFTLKLIISICSVLIYWILSCSNKKENKLRSAILDISMKILVAIHQTDFSKRLIFAFTTLCSSIQIFDYFVLFVDFSMTGFFQFWIFECMKKKIKLEKEDKTQIDERFLKEIFQYTKNGDRIELPAITLYNIQFLGKILVVFLLGKYPFILAISLFLLSFFFLFLDFFLLKANNLSVVILWLIRGVFFFENLLMILISSNQILKNFQENESFWNFISLIYLLAIGVFFSITFVVIIERICFSRKKNVIKKIEKKIIEEVDQPDLEVEKSDFEDENDEGSLQDKVVIRFKKSIFQSKMAKRNKVEPNRNRRASKLWRFSRNKKLNHRRRSSLWKKNLPNPKSPIRLTSKFKKTKKN